MLSGLHSGARRDQTAWQPAWSAPREATGISPRRPHRAPRGPYLDPMTHRVDTRGRFTIERAIRDALGVRPDDVAVQSVENGSLVVKFMRLPAPHERSLAGIVGPPPQSPSDESWEDAVAGEIVAAETAASGPPVLAP